MINFKLFTIFPDLFPGPLSYSVTGKALEKNLWSYEVINIRNYAKDKHKTVDDTPYGGGAGMILKPDVISDAFDQNQVTKASKIIYLSPRGKILNQIMAKDLANLSELNILCGRYEGVDQRVLDEYDVEELSIGNYILSGGEIAAYVLIDSVLRNLDGVLGSSKSNDEETFNIYISATSYNILEYDHFTKPDVWNGRRVPDVLTKGNHKKIREWKENNSLERTKKNRQDLLV